MPLEPGAPTRLEILRVVASLLPEALVDRETVTALVDDYLSRIQIGASATAEGVGREIIEEKRVQLGRAAGEALGGVPYGG